MADTSVRSSRDWLGNVRTNMLAWWVPHAAMLAALFLRVPVRAVVWIVALIWMGSACTLNARQCGRTHCRYTGPYYLAMIVPVLVLASSWCLCQFLWVDYIGRCYRRGQRDHLEGLRASMGKIFVA